MASTNGTGDGSGSPYSPVYKDRLLDQNEVCACFIVEQGKKREVTLIDFPGQPTDFLNEFKRATTQSLDSFLDKCSIGSKATVKLTEIAFTVYLFAGEDKQKVAMVVEGANVDPPDPLQSLSAVLTKFLDHSVFWNYQPKRRRRSSMIGLSNIEEVFRTIDINGDGLLQRAEFRQGLIALGVQFDDDQMDRVFAVISDGKESINYHQFFRFVMDAELGKGFKELAEVRQAITGSMQQPPFKQLKDPTGKIRKLKYLEKVLYVMRFHCAEPSLDKATEQKWLNRWKMHRERIAKYQELLSTYISKENTKLRSKLKASSKKKERTAGQNTRREQEFQIMLAEKEMELKLLKKSDRRRARSNSLPTANPQNTEVFNLRRELKQLNREKVELQTKLRKKEQQQLQRVFGEKKQRIAEMDHHLKTLHTQLRKLRKEKQSLQDNYEKLRRKQKSKIIRLEMEQRNHPVSRKKAERARDEAERANENLRKLNRQLKNERKQLTQQVITLEGQVQRIDRKLQQEEPIQRDPRNAVGRITHYKHENRQLKEQLRDLLAQHSTTVKTQARGVMELEKKLNETEKRLRDQLRTITTLQGENKSLHGEVGRLEGSRADAEEARERAESEAAQERQARLGASDGGESRELELQVQALREQLRSADEQLAEANQFGEDTARRNEQLRNMFEKSQEEMDKQRRQIGRLEDRQAELGLLREQNEKMSQRLGAAESELQQHRSQAQERVRQPSPNPELTSRNRKLQAKINELSRSNAQLQQALQNAPLPSNRVTAVKPVRKSSTGSGSSPRKGPKKAKGRVPPIPRPGFSKLSSFGKLPKPKKSKSNGKKNRRTKTSKTPTKSMKRTRTGPRPVGPKNGLSPRRKAKKKTPRAAPAPKPKSSGPSSTSSKTPLPDSPEIGPSSASGPSSMGALSPQLPPETPRTPKVLDFSAGLRSAAPKAATLPPHTTPLPDDDRDSEEPQVLSRPAEPESKEAPAAASAAHALPPESNSSSDSMYKQNSEDDPAPPPRPQSASAPPASKSPPPEASSGEGKIEVPSPAEMEKLQKQISDLDLQYRIKCEQINALRNATKIYKNSISDKSEYQAELEKQMQLFQERLIDRNEELHARTHELQQANEKAKHMGLELKRTRETLDAMQSESGEDGGAPIANLMERLADRDAVLLAKDEEIQKLQQFQKTVDKLQTMKQMLQQELDSSKEKNKKLTTQIAKLKGELQEIQAGSSLKQYVEATDLQTKFLRAALAGDDSASELEAEISSAAMSEPRLKHLSTLLPQVRTRLLAHLEDDACPAPSQI